MRSKFGMRYLVMPQLTPYITPVSDPDIMRLAYYYEQMPPGNRLPLFVQREGFIVKERVTYRITNLHDKTEENLTERFSGNKKRQLRKASALIADYSLSPITFYDLHAVWLKERGRKIFYDKAFFIGLAQAAIQHDAGCLIALKDEKEEVYAAAFIVWDAETCYYLVPSFNPRHADSGAGAALVLESLRKAKERGCNVFDFEGGDQSESVALHYSQFGSEQASYYGIERYYKPIVRFLFTIRKAVCRPRR